MINVFFESYRRAFERWDKSDIADHFTFPLHITADGTEIGVTSVPDHDVWMDQLDRLLNMYRAIEVNAVRIIELTVTQLSPRLGQAIVHWELYDRAERPLYDFRAAYTLVQIGDSLRISAIAHDEIPRYRAYAARLRTSDPAPGASRPGGAV